MKKIHGTHSIQPNSITDAVISPDAQIDESKVGLAHTTANLKSEIEGVDSELTDHKDTSVNPHGNRLTQSIVRTPNIEGSPSPTDSIINVSNPGGGDVIVDVAGETRSTRLHAGDANIEDALIVGGDTLIKGDLLIEGRYTVAHVTESEYKVMRVHPYASTAMDALSIVPVIQETDSEIDNLNQPMGVLIDQNGNLLISDSGNHNIKKFTPTGNLIATYHSSGSSMPTSMAIYNNVLVVVDIANKTVARRNAVDGSLISYLNDSINFVSPYAVTVDKYGNIYVTESEGASKGIYKFASEGALIGKLSYEFTSPKGIAAKDDNLYVLDGNDIVLLDLNGEYQNTFGADFGVASLLSPTSIVAKDDKVYVADTGHHRVQMFDVEEESVEVGGGDPITSKVGVIGEDVVVNYTYPGFLLSEHYMSSTSEEPEPELLLSKGMLDTTILENLDRIKFHSDIFDPIFLQNAIACAHGGNLQQLDNGDLVTLRKKQGADTFNLIRLNALGQIVSTTELSGPNAPAAGGVNELRTTIGQDGFFYVYERVSVNELSVFKVTLEGIVLWNRMLDLTPGIAVSFNSSPALVYLRVLPQGDIALLAQDDDEIEVFVYNEEAIFQHSVGRASYSWLLPLTDHCFTATPTGKIVVCISDPPNTKVLVSTDASEDSLVDVTDSLLVAGVDALFYVDIKEAVEGSLNLVGIAFITDEESLEMTVALTSVAASYLQASTEMYSVSSSETIVKLDSVNMMTASSYAISLREIHYLEQLFKHLSVNVMDHENKKAYLVGKDGSNIMEFDLARQKHKLLNTIDRYPVGPVSTMRYVFDEDKMELLEAETVPEGTIGWISYEPAPELDYVESRDKYVVSLVTEDRLRQFQGLENTSVVAWSGYYFYDSVSHKIVENQTQKWEVEEGEYTDNELYEIVRDTSDMPGVPVGIHRIKFAPYDSNSIEYIDICVKSKSALRTDLTAVKYGMEGYYPDLTKTFDPAINIVSSCAGVTYANVFVAEHSQDLLTEGYSDAEYYTVIYLLDAASNSIHVLNATTLNVIKTVHIAAEDLDIIGTPNKIYQYLSGDEFKRLLCIEGSTGNRIYYSPYSLTRVIGVEKEENPTVTFYSDSKLIPANSEDNYQGADYSKIPQVTNLYEVTNPFGGTQLLSRNYVKHNWLNMQDIIGSTPIGPDVDSVEVLLRLGMISSGLDLQAATGEDLLGNLIIACYERAAILKVNVDGSSQTIEGVHIGKKPSQASISTNAIQVNSAGKVFIRHSTGVRVFDSSFNALYNIDLPSLIDSLYNLEFVEGLDDNTSIIIDGDDRLIVPWNSGVLVFNSQTGVLISHSTETASTDNAYCLKGSDVFIYNNDDLTVERRSVNSLVAGSQQAPTISTSIASYISNVASTLDGEIVPIGELFFDAPPALYFSGQLSGNVVRLCPGVIVIKDRTPTQGEIDEINSHGVHFSQDILMSLMGVEAYILELTLDGASLEVESHTFKNIMPCAMSELPLFKGKVLSHSKVMPNLDSATKVQLIFSYLLMFNDNPFSLSLGYLLEHVPFLTKIEGESVDVSLAPSSTRIEKLSNGGFVYSVGALNHNFFAGMYMLDGDYYQGLQGSGDIASSLVQVPLLPLIQIELDGTSYVYRLSLSTLFGELAMLADIEEILFDDSGDWFLSLLTECVSGVAIVDDTVLATFGGELYSLLEGVPTKLTTLDTHGALVGVPIKLGNFLACIRLTAWEDMPLLTWFLGSVASNPSPMLLLNADTYDKVKDLDAPFGGGLFNTFIPNNAVGDAVYAVPVKFIAMPKILGEGDMESFHALTKISLSDDLEIVVDAEADATMGAVTGIQSSGRLEVTFADITSSGMQINSVTLDSVKTLTATGTTSITQPTLNPSTSIGTHGNSVNNLNSPTDLTLDEDNNIYVADTGNNAVKVFDKHGQPVTKFSEDEETYYGNLLNLNKRIEGQLSPALTLNYKGEMSLPSGVVYIGETLLTDIGHEAYVSKPLATSKITTTADGFRYVASDTYSGGHSVLNLKDADGSDIINVDYAGRASIKNSLSINGSNPITFDGATDTLKLSENTQIAGDLSVLSGKINLVEDESIKSVIESRSGDIGIGFHDHNNFEHRTIISSNEVEIRQATTKVNDLDVKGNMYIAPGKTVDGVDVGTHDHSGAAGRGVQLPTTSVVGLASFISSIDDTVRTNVTSVLGSNTLAVNKIKFTYDDGTGKVMATLANFSITIAGDAEGIATVNELSNTTLTVSVKNSAKLAGMLPSTTVNTEANRVVKTDAGGDITFKKVTMQPASSTSAIGCLLASDKAIGDTSHEVKKFPVTDIAGTVLTHGSFKNAHTHDKVNNMYVLRGSSVTQSNVGQVIYIDVREDTNYSVSITPNAAGVGEIWVVKALDSFTVYNDGGANITFDWLLVG